MTEITLGVFDISTGKLLVDAEIDAGADLTGGEPTGCAKPAGQVQAIQVGQSDGPRISGIWHNDFMVGPGRRSVVRFQGCPIRCVGCWVPETHDFDSGHNVPVEMLADHLLNRSYERDGVTILGGEPFAQPEALLELVKALVKRDISTHITVYTGFTLEALRKRDNQAIDLALNLIDMLIDGPYVQALAHASDSPDEQRRWTGSTNQRVHNFRPNSPA